MTTTMTMPVTSGAVPFWPCAIPATTNPAACGTSDHEDPDQAGSQDAREMVQQPTSEMTQH